MCHPQQRWLTCTPSGATRPAAFTSIAAEHSSIVNSIGDVTIPGGAALNLGQCDHDFCGDPSVGGNNECIPYCKWSTSPWARSGEHHEAATIATRRGLEVEATRR